MAYLDYSALVGGTVTQQFNVMALVGNGFDIQVLAEYGRAPSTRYQDFYHFLQMRRVGSDNAIIQEMTRRRVGQEANWSDVEDCVADLVRDSGTFGIREALAEIQHEFSEFLNLVSDSSVLARLNDDAMSCGWSKRCLSSFLRDIEDADELAKIPFGSRKANYDLFNFYFINLNFTALLDNYLYLDQEQFDPRPHSTAATNFRFDTNPRRLRASKGWNYKSSSYLVTEVVHPHGYQDIPRSLLFGTGDMDSRDRRRERISKPYWAQNDVKYQHLFDDTSVFVVFGCSLGATDEWWWKMIVQALRADRENALVLYWWSSEDRQDAIDDALGTFFKVAGVERKEEHELGEKICVIPFRSATDHVWLGMGREDDPAGDSV
ncbi:AbiH family protein [Demequina sediminicola]|uniref:AbiH family protein n=1 Tax=Demequina sediminicola TaxID=1095026 RepID=UPI00078574C6|nr:AbiH family protein [Demequina sediminicola]